MDRNLSHLILDGADDQEWQASGDQADISHISGE
jgi:hypothetical protein